MMRWLGLILTLAAALASGPAIAQSLNPFDYPPEVRMPTLQETRDARVANAAATAANARGDLDEAGTLYLVALELLDRTFGPSHPFTLEVSMTYALNRASAGDYATARPLLEQAATGLRRYYGDDEPTVRQTLSVLATVYRDLGETDRAIRILTWMVNRDLDNPEVKPAEVLPQLLSLAGVLIAADRHGEAQPVVDVSVRAYAELGREEPRFAQHLAVLSGHIHAAQDRPLEAEAAYRRALAIEVSGSDSGQGPRIRLQTLQSLADVLTRTEQGGEALETYRDMGAVLTARAGAEGRGRSEVNAYADVFRGLVRAAWTVEAEGGR